MNKQYEKGFIAGSELTGRLSEEYWAIKLAEQKEKMDRELEIADERWKRAEAHHNQYHESDTEICINPLK